MGKIISNGIEYTGGISSELLNTIDNIQKKAISLESSINSLNTSCFKSRDWVPNGAEISALSTGIYGTNPNNLPKIGIPEGYSPYGSLIIAHSNYSTILYNDVYGNIASYNTNQGKWTNYYSSTTVDAIIANNRVKSVTIDDACVTSNTIGSNNAMYGTGYTYYGTTSGVSRSTIDSLVAAGHTILGGFISRGACNDTENVNNVAAYSGTIVNYNTYYNCPYQVIYVSNGYQTIHCRITILYI